MLLLVLSICLRSTLSASSSDSEDTTTTRIDIFERYAGNLIYDDNGTDGSCIACNGSCTREYAVSPHSWTAKLEYTVGDYVYTNEIDKCEEYATSTAEYGVVAYTWWESEHICRLHVTTSEENIAELMINYNGFNWTEEHRYNTGPLFLVRYPTDTDESTMQAQCYYGLNINQTPNIAKEANKVIIATVVVIMLAWNGWMKHTNQYPADLMKSSATDDEIKNAHDDDIYTKKEE